MTSIPTDEGAAVLSRDDVIERLEFLAGHTHESTLLYGCVAAETFAAAAAMLRGNSAAPRSGVSKDGLTAQAVSGNGAASTEVEAPTDTQRLDWLEQQHWDRDELHDLVNDWCHKGKRYSAGLRAAIDAARTAISAALRGKD